MARFIAFLRAINVGGRTVKMDRLKTLFEEMGLRDVETFIASGNVIFESGVRDPAKLEARIEQHLAESLGYQVDTFLRTPGELARIVGFDPFPDVDTSQGAMSVAFLAAPPPVEAAAKVSAYRTEVDRFLVEGREIYWHCLTKISDSKAPMGFLEKTLKIPSTVRNITTVRKLAARWKE